MNPLFLFLKICAFLYFLFVAPSATAQAHNGECYRQLMATFFQKNGNTYKQLSGEPLRIWIPAYEIDSTAGSQLFISPPEIDYIGLGKKRFKRSLSIALNLQDSVMRSEQLVYSDTLSLKQIKAIRKVSPDELKGDTPGFSSKIAQPLVIVTSSVALIVALFYIRSQ